MEVRVVGESVRSGKKVTRNIDDFEIKIHEVE